MVKGVLYYYFQKSLFFILPTSPILFVGVDETGEFIAHEAYGLEGED
jgi:hypothetical protein